ncbi:FAD/NAD(P)-binding domain-containing protein [Astrocystis sublimbata]|nr:FAD/NAD(P)-binding domain-containing protein [Astrocystis sublimbata]
MTLKILVIGAGVCGPAFVTLLRRADPELKRYEITVVERAPKLRDTGLQIDIREQGIPVCRKMGLIEAIRKRVVPERGVSFVDAQSRSFAAFGKNDSGQGAQTMTSEYEIMRGDLVDVFYRASLGWNTDKQETSDSSTFKEKASASVTDDTGRVRYEFGLTVTSITQQYQDPDSGVSVAFSDGRQETYDLVVGADGQSSRTRRMILDDSEARFHSLNLFTAHYLLPRGADDNEWMNVHLMPGKRAIFTRSAQLDKPTQVYLAVQTDRAQDRYGVASAVTESSTASSAVVGDQKSAFVTAFADHEGWRTPALVDGLKKLAEDDDFYAMEVGQVKCERYVSGRVVLLGDAGYCPSPITGMGTTLSLTGAYLLAGELTRHAEGDVVAALKAYEDEMKPFVKQAQRLIPGVPRIVYAESDWGVWILTTIISLIANSGIVDLVSRFLPESGGGRKLPEFPELNLDG